MLFILVVLSRVVAAAWPRALKYSNAAEAAAAKTKVKAEEASMK